MKEFELKYGCNPNQKPAKIFMEDGSKLPIEILNGRPGYINFLDAFNSWQLVHEIKKILNIKLINCVPLALGLAVYRAWKNAIAIYPLDGTILMIILSGLAVIVYLIIIAMYV